MGNYLSSILTNHDGFFRFESPKMKGPKTHIEGNSYKRKMTIPVCGEGPISLGCVGFFHGLVAFLRGCCMCKFFRAVSQFLKSAKKDVGLRRLRMEGLEERALLTVVWTNRGTTDNFGTYYGANATTARSIVDHAIADWNRVLLNFNYQNVGIPGNASAANTNNVQIFAAPLSAGVGGLTDNILTDWQGKPYQSRIQLDDNGAGAGWYFDTAIASDSEFDYVNDHFRATATSGAPLNLTDLYMIAAHEIGHAVGIFGHLTNTSDLMTTTLPLSNRRLISDADINYLVGAFTSNPYTTASPSTTDSMYATLNGTSATDILVRGWGGAGNDIMQISKSGSNLVVAANGTSENLPYTNYGNLTVNTFDGSDSVSMNLSLDDNLFLYTSIDLGLGSDVLSYSTSNGATYGVTISYNAIQRNYRPSGPSAYPAVYFYSAETLVVNGSDQNDQFIVGPFSSGNGVTQYMFFSWGGNDEIDASYATVAVIAYGGTGNDTIRGGSAGDQLYGDDGADQIWGYDGGDTLQGGAGADIIRGGNGADILYDGLIGWLDTAAIDQLYGEGDADGFYSSSGDTVVQ